MGGQDGQLYQVAGGGFNFQHVDFRHAYYLNRTVSLEILTGALNATDLRVGMNEKGCTLTFHSNYGCEFQLSQDSGNRLKVDYTGILMDTIMAGTSFNGTITADTDVMLHWEYVYQTPIEENWNLYLGLLGIACLVIGILLVVYCFRHYPLMTFNQNKEMVWETNMLMYAIVLIIIGAGLVITWLLM